MSTLNENKRKLTSIRGMGAALVGFAGWIVLYIVFGLIEPNIFTTNNMLNLLRSMAKYLLVGVGQGVILITGNIDLSIGSVVAMSAMISATMMSKGVAAIIAILAAIVCCLAVGVINGVLVGKFKLPPFIATLGTMFCARGVAYMANGNRNTDAIVSGLGKEAGDAFQNFFYYGKFLGIYNAFWIAFVIFLAVFFIMSKTRTGRHIYAIGSNVDAAKLSGVNVRRSRRRYRRYLSSGRQRPAAGRFRRSRCVADPGKRPGHYRRSRRHSENRHWRDCGWRCAGGCGIPSGCQESQEIICYFRGKPRE